MVQPCGFTCEMTNVHKLFKERYTRVHQTVQNVIIYIPACKWTRTWIHNHTLTEAHLLVQTAHTSTQYGNVSFHFMCGETLLTHIYCTHRQMGFQVTAGPAAKWRKLCHPNLLRRCLPAFLKSLLTDLYCECPRNSEVCRKANCTFIRKRADCHAEDFNLLK